MVHQWIILFLLLISSPMHHLLAGLYPLSCGSVLSMLADFPAKREFTSNNLLPGFIVLIGLQTIYENIYKLKNI